MGWCSVRTRCPHSRITARNDLAAALLLLLAVLSGAGAFAEPPRNTPQPFPGPATSSQISNSLDLAPSNPLALPAVTGGPHQGNSFQLSEEVLKDILPPIPNLRFGYIYSFGERVRQQRFTFDYMVPVRVNGRDILFGEVHSRFEDLLKTIKGYPDSAVGLVVGGGYRKRINDDLMAGVSGFYHAKRFFGRWDSSEIIGLKVAASTGDGGVTIVKFNYYGRILSGPDTIVNILPAVLQQGNFMVKLAYEQPLWNGEASLRVKANAYRFYQGSPIYGWNGGLEFKARDGMFDVRYVVGRDELSGTYHTLVLYVNLGFDVDRLLTGQSPLTRPR